MPHTPHVPCLRPVSYQGGRLTVPMETVLRVLRANTAARSHTQVRPAADTCTHATTHPALV